MTVTITPRLLAAAAAVIAITGVLLIYATKSGKSAPPPGPQGGAGDSIVQSGATMPVGSGNGSPAAATRGSNGSASSGSSASATRAPSAVPGTPLLRVTVSTDVTVVVSAPATVLVGGTAPTPTPQPGGGGPATSLAPGAGGLPPPGDPGRASSLAPGAVNATAISVTATRGTLSPQYIDVSVGQGSYVYIELANRESYDLGLRLFHCSGSVGNSCDDLSVPLGFICPALTTCRSDVFAAPAPGLYVYYRGPLENGAYDGNHPVNITFR